ncbi:MAG: sugar phosphate nucleotidyltransferase [Candidatus Kariarchaeaceae archaeon]
MTEISEKWMAVVLAGGIGTRLFPLTQEQPKPLLPVANRPMIECTLEMIIATGIKKIVIAVRYLGDQIETWIKDQDFGDVEIIVSNEDSKDTADAVRLAAKHIDRNFVVTMADIITNLDLRKAIEFHESYNPLATICLKPVELPGQFGLTMIDNESRIHLFLEKPTPTELLMTTLTFTARDDVLYMQSNLANIGIYICSQELVSIITGFGELMDFGKNVFPYLLDHKHDVRGFLSNPYWIDAGTHTKYIWTNNDIAKRWGHPYLPKEPERSENTWIGDDVDIADDAILKAPIVIGNGTVIGQGSVIGPFVTIGSNVVIGDKVEIEQCVLMEGAIVNNKVNLKKTILSDSVEISEELSLFKQVVPKNTKIKVIDDKFRWS